VPTGVVVEPIISVTSDVTSTSPNAENVYLSSLSLTDVVSDGSNGQVSIAASTGGNLQTSDAVAGVFTNTSGQIRSRQNQGGSAQTIRLRTHGWIDRRGRDD